jgi:CheY-like chemotaxis protein
MTSTATCASKTILVVETDIILRIAIAEYLRGCGLRVIEASSALEAKIVLQRGPAVDVLFADARVAGEEGGFALAQWTRRYRSSIAIVLTSSLANKSEAAAKLCGQHHSAPPPASHLRSRIESMRAQRVRRAQGPRRSGRSRASG